MRVAYCLVAGVPADARNACRAAPKRWAAGMSPTVVSWGCPVGHEQTSGDRRSGPDRCLQVRLELDELAAAVVELVTRVPAGQVVTYGDIARRLGCGPRQVGSVMSQLGELAPWWRVVDAAGRLPPRLRPRAWQRWQEEATPLVDAGVPAVQARVRLRAARAVLPASADLSWTQPSHSAGRRCD